MSFIFVKKLNDEKKYYEDTKENAAFESCVDVMTELILKYGPSLKRRWALEKLMANVWLECLAELP